MFGIEYLKAPPTTYVLHYKSGKVKREGAGLSFLYYRPTSTVVMVPAATADVPFAWTEVTADFQEVTIQGQRVSPLFGFAASDAIGGSGPGGKESAPPLVRVGDPCGDGDGGGIVGSDRTPVWSASTLTVASAGGVEPRISMLGRVAPSRAETSFARALLEGSRNGPASSGTTSAGGRAPISAS